LNSGSSSIKFSVYEAGNGERRKLHEGAVDGIGTDQGKFWIKDADGKKLVDQSPALPDRAVAFKLVADALHSSDFPSPAAIGHRVVCGGPTVQENQIVTPALIDEIEKYTDFAPLHTPIVVYIMREALRLFPGIKNFAVLDTYFHRTMPEVVTHMPIPEEYSAMGVRRYGYRVDCVPVAAECAGEVDRGAFGQRGFDFGDSRGQVPGYFDGIDADGGHHQRNAHGRHRSGRAVVYSAQDCGDGD
jgi:acetate kinase